MSDRLVHNVLQPKGSSKEKGKGKKQEEEEEEEEERVKRAAKASKEDSPILDKEVVQVQAGTKPTQSGSASPPIEEIEVNPSAIVARGVSVPSNGFSRSACLVWIVSSRVRTEKPSVSLDHAATERLHN